MSQVSYAQSMPVAFNGMKSDIRDDVVITLQAAEEIPFGCAVVKSLGSDQQGRLPKANKVVATDDAGTFTAGTIALTVDGVAVSQLFDTSKDITLTALAVKIAAVAGIVSAVYGAAGHTITVISRNTNLALVWVLTGISAGTIAAIANVSSTNDSDIAGFSMSDSAREQSLVTGIVSYKATEAVNVMQTGALYCYTEDAVTSDSVVHVRAIANGATKLPGMVLSTTDSGKAFAVSGAKFRSSAAAGGLVIVDISRP